jgi:hypothetical protein
VIGWLMLVGGVVRPVVPQLAIGIGTTVYGSGAALVIFAAVSLVLGGFLSFKGYQHGTAVFMQAAAVRHYRAPTTMWISGSGTFPTYELSGRRFAPKGKSRRDYRL